MKKIIKCGELFDAAGKDVKKDVSIIVDGNLISAVVPTAGLDCAGAEVIDLSDKFVMPGLIDTHVHLYFDGYVDGFAPFLHQTHGEILIDAMLRGQRDLLAGFTSLRDCGCGTFGTDIALKKAINDGRIHGPRLCVSGGMIVTSAMQNIYTEGAYSVNSAGEARAAARDTIAKGADQVKLMVTIGVLSNGDNLGASAMDYEEIAAACQVAQSLGCITSAHAHGPQGIMDAVRAGITSIEHGVLMDEQCAEKMVERGTYLVPTLVTAHYMLQHADQISPPVLAKERFASSRHKESFAMAYKKGVKIAFGTDTGTPYNLHGKQAVEFKIMCDCGMTPEDALLTATRNAAEMMRWDKLVGTVEPGKFADIAAFDRSPLKDMTVMTDCSFVMKDGTVYKGPNAQTLTLG